MKIVYQKIRTFKMRNGWDDGGGNSGILQMLMVFSKYISQTFPIVQRNKYDR